jgi:hypothetical protein
MCTGWPSKRTSPESAAWMPAMILISVDFPAPLSSHLEVDVRQRLDGAERLGDVAELEDRGLGGVSGVGCHGDFGS